MLARVLLFGSVAMVSVGYMDSRNRACPECGIGKVDFEMVEIYNTQGSAS